MINENQLDIWLLVSFYSQLIFSVLSLYISGSLFISLSLVDLLYQIVGLLSSFLAYWYSELYYLYDFLYKFLWFIFSFGTNVLTFNIMKIFFIQFFTTIKDFNLLTSEKSKQNFKEDYEEMKPVWLKYIVHIKTFCILFSLFLILVEFFVIGEISYSIIMFLSSLSLMLIVYLFSNYEFWII